MIKRIKKIRNVSLVIILIILILTSIVLGVIKLQNNEKETSSDTLINHEIKQEESAQEVIEEEEEIIDLVEDEEIEEEQEEIQEKSQEESAGTKYFIRVNYGQNVVTVYTKDSNGEYTIPVKAMVCSTGRATPKSGTYSIPGQGSKSPRGVWGKMIGNVWAQYYTRIKGSILFHSVPYVSKDKSTLEYWEYDKLGTTASAGCIRLTVEDAKWIYENCEKGTKVEF